MNEGIERLCELPPAKRCVAVAAIALQLGLFVAAELDIHRRCANEIRGSKARWRLICLLNFIGPISYFRWGRLPSAR
jgi:hypothetical protein